MKRMQITVDDETAQKIEALAGTRAGNKSFVVREAVRRMAEQEGFEDYLDWLEQTPTVRKSMERAAEDERHGRTVSHSEARKRLQSRQS